MNWYAKILLTALCIISSAAAQDSLTVEQVVQRVLQNHPTIEHALAESRAAEARVLQSSSAKLPELTTEALYMHIGPVPAFNFGGQNLLLAPNDNYDAYITGRYTLYDFGKTNAFVRLNQSRVQSTNGMIVLTQANLSLQTVRTFYTIVLMRKSIEVQNEQIDALSQHILVTQKRLAAGTATNFDVLTTQVHVASAQNQKVDIQNSLEKQEAVLRQLLGLPANSNLPISGTFLLKPVILNEDSLLQLALKQRIELKLAHDAELSASLQKNLSSLGNMPSLKMNLQYGFKNGYEPNIFAMRGNWVWGLQAEFPVFDGRRVHHQEEESQALIEAEHAHSLEVEQQIRSDVEQVWADVQAALERVHISEVQLHQAHEAVLIARTRYETGSITNLDLLDAETGESAARLMSLQALYRYVVSTYELARAVGNPIV